MKHCRVSAFARVARFVACAAVALGLGAGPLLAQGSTGKIEGRVRDQAGAPIANAQVFVVGTAFNALTNPQGYYFINNVPASSVAVRAAVTELLDEIWPVVAQLKNHENPIHGPSAPI